MRSIPFYPMMVLLLIGLGGYLGCDPNSISVPADDDNQVVPTSSTNSLQNAILTASIPDRVADRILIGSFNIQRLGPSKLADPWIMNKLADVISRFDVIALQEITSKDQRTLPQLVELVNRAGANYAYTISPRIGRESTGYFEQYAFVYDASRIRGGPNFCYVVQDDADVLHREPFVGRFETTGTQQPFSFTLINIHTDPDEISIELDVLADVFVNVRQFEYPEDDVLLLGDLNAAPDKLQKLGRIPGFAPLINGLPTNSRKNKTLDNILADRQFTREFTGRAGTIDLEQMFRIQMNDAERISDHVPIWAEFSINELSSGLAAAASAPGSVAR